VGARPDRGGHVLRPTERFGTAIVLGNVLGGSTAQGFPVVLETSKAGRMVTRAMVAIRLSCSSGGTVTVPDGYQKLAVSRTRKFSSAFGPLTQRNDDGTTTDFEGTISGTFNKSRTSVSGTWSLKGTDHDAAGAVTDTCDSGRVNWKATQ
jgi:hypothetical protein